MSPVRFAVQVAGVVTLAALVSWPELRANQFFAPPTVLTTGSSTPGDGRRLPGRSDRTAGEIGFGRASYVSTPGAPSLEEKLAENAYENRRSAIPDELRALGARFNGILGYTRTSTNAIIPFARVWLRNVRTGEIEARAIADQSGQFVFLDIRPTGYVVELVDGPDGTVIAASSLVSVGIGDLHRTTLFVPVGGPATTAAGAPQQISTAADTGVSKVGQPERAVSPQR